MHLSFVCMASFPRNHTDFGADISPICSSTNFINLCTKKRQQYLYSEHPNHQCLCIRDLASPIESANAEFSHIWRNESLWYHRVPLTLKVYPIYARTCGLGTVSPWPPPAPQQWWHYARTKCHIPDSFSSTSSSVWWRSASLIITILDEHWTPLSFTWWSMCTQRWWHTERCLGDRLLSRCWLYDAPCSRTIQRTRKYA